MSMTARTNRSRRVLLLVGGLVALCACLVIMVGAIGLTSLGGTASPQSSMPTQAAAGAVPTRTPGSPGAAPTSGPPARRSPTVAPTVGSAQSVTGELHLDYPLTLNVDKDEIVSIEIIPDQPVALAGASPLAPAGKLLVESGSSDAPRKSVSYSIPLYPAMSAELATASPDLNIVAGSESKQVINPFDRNFWTWSIVARRGGEYRITLRVFGYASLADDDPLKQVVSDTRVVRGSERPFFERMMQGLADNWLVLFGAGGPLALILAALSFWLTRRDTKPKS